MHKEHHYTVAVKWTGNRGTGTSHASEYDRANTLSIAGKPDLLCSSDPAFRGDSTKYNPEDMLLASVSQCHMLWHLHLCADAGVVITDYTDNPTAIMVEASAEGRGRFTEITLHPTVVVTEEWMIAKANELHAKANEMCFISNSCNFPIHHQPTAVTSA
jgi:organic hydroperoxide reductase OsmC/OhrA